MREQSFRSGIIITRFSSIHAYSFSGDDNSPIVDRRDSIKRISRQLSVVVSCRWIWEVSRCSDNRNIHRYMERNKSKLFGMPAILITTLWTCAAYPTRQEAIGRVPCLQTDNQYGVFNYTRYMHWRNNKLFRTSNISTWVWKLDTISNNTWLEYTA